MKDEIKEILDNINNKWEDYKEKTKQLEYVQDIVSGNDFKQLLDYITNLQDRIKKLETINEEHRRINGELREENKRLKELCDKYEEEHNTAFKLWTMKMEEIPTYEEKKELQNRIDKAIEYINKHFHWGINGNDNIEDLLNILQGEQNE